MVNLNSKLVSYFHDSPDKAIKIQNHINRAEKIVKSAGVQFELSKVVQRADQMASSAQRFTFKVDGKIPVSDFYGKSQGKYFQIGNPVLLHPVTSEIYLDFTSLATIIRDIRSNSGERGFEKFLNLIINCEATALKKTIDESRVKFSEEWRQWAYIWQNYRKNLEEELKTSLRKLGLPKEKIESIVTELLNLPAETRFPDHTIWHHLDLVSSLAVNDPVLLRIQIVPVQAFIKHSRKELDLWASSHLLSMLMFKALEPIIEKCGPEVIIYPSLRNQPLFLKFILERNSNGISVANIPNKALAIIPESAFEGIKDEIKNNVRRFLRDLYEDAIDWAIKEYNLPDGTKDERYWKILEEYFTISLDYVPLYGQLNFEEAKRILSDAGLLTEDVTKWLNMIEKTSKEFKSVERIYTIFLYPFLVKILDALGLAKVTLERYNKTPQKDGWKCWVCGENLSILGDTLSYGDLRKMWRDEPLCPVCLLKRYYPAWFRKHFGKDIGFESVTDVALRYNNWISTFEEEYGNEFSGVLKKINESLVIQGRPIDSDLYYVENLTEQAIKKILRKSGKDGEINCDLIQTAREVLKNAYKEIGKPSKYYAILVMDGDDMGRLISGEVETGSFFLINRLHESLKNYFKKECGAENVRYYPTPQLHRSISEALANFALHEVPKEVEGNGILIYAGGDDVLALFPVDTAIKTALEIRNAFRSTGKDGRILPGWRISAGLLIVHYRHPLYDALDKARILLKKAKSKSGKNSIAIGLLKRSGSYYEGAYPWGVLEKLENLAKLARDKKVSKRFIYHILKELDVWPEEALEELLKYELNRHVEKNYRKEVLDLLKKVMREMNKEEIRNIVTFLKILTDEEVFP